MANTDTKEFKSGFVTLIGRPNVSKSTLMNHLIGQKIAITSEKPQTTRNRIQTVYTDERGQIIFLDTPGIHKAKNKLGEYMVNVAENTLKEVDVILWLVEPTTFIGAGERHIAEQLSKIKTPVILVINKIDTVKSKEEILTFIAAYKDILNFAEIIPVSALKEMNIEDVKSSIFKYLPSGPQFYDEDTVTDQPMRQIIIDEDATIVCERDSHKGIIIGKGGSMLKRIGTAARMEIENLMDTKVNLKLWVKVRREWRDSDMYMKNYGYNPKEI